MNATRLPIIAVLAASILSIAATSARAETANGGDAAFMAQLREIVAKERAKVLRVCRLGAVPPTPLVGTPVYSGVAVAGIAANPTGIVAMADLGLGDAKKAKVLIFTRGLSQSPVSVPIPGAFTERSLRYPMTGDLWPGWRESGEAPPSTTSPGPGFRNSSKLRTPALASGSAASCLCGIVPIRWSCFGRVTTDSYPRT
jgi:hypothetical protein